jgi:hypothetical protein
MVQSVRVPNFSPSQNGFPFPNSYPPGNPVILAETPFGDLRAGDASRGLCGGMIFTTIDLYLHGTTSIPRTLTPELFRYFCRRLMASWNLPFGGLKYYAWQLRNGSSRRVGGVRWSKGLSYLTIVEEWPRIRKSLEAGIPAALGLVKVRGWNPFKLGLNHQVLAYGFDYDDASGDLTIWIYDPNYPGDDTCAIRMNVLHPDLDRPVIHSCEGPSVRGFFWTDYAKPCTAPRFED